MLTREHGIAGYCDGRIIPDRLTPGRHGHYLPIAQRLLDAYGTGIGLTRRELYRRVAEAFAEELDCPSRRIEAFCKLLDDASTYEGDRAGRAARLRRRVFRLASDKHPLVKQQDGLFEHEEGLVKAAIALELGLPWEEIEGQLFADVMEFHRLAAFQGYPDARALLSRYNVAQVQVALFLALEMTIWARRDFKAILRHVKLAGLMHRIRRLGEGEYEIRLDGPASLSRHTRLYGVSMAKLLPGLLACRDWRLQARISTPRKGLRVSLELSPQDGLSSHLPPPAEFDSGLEADFARKWGDEPREGWRLVREGEILHKGQKVFVPDFVFSRQDGRGVPLEIIGFWTPEYLRDKVQTIREFRGQPILLAVGQAGTARISGLPPEAIRFKTTLTVKEVLDGLKRLGA